MVNQREKLLLTVMEAAAETGVCRAVAYEMAARGVWPTVRIGRSVRIPRAGLLDWIERNTVQVGGASSRETRR